MFILHNYNIITIEQLFMSPFSPSPDNHLVFSTFMILTLLDTSFNYNYTIFLLLWLACFNEHNIFQVHPCCSFFVRPNNIILYEYTKISLSIDMLIDIWVVSISWLLWIMLQLTCECSYLFDPGFNSFGNTPTNGIAMLYDSSIFSFHNVFHSGYTILHAHKQCAKVPVSPYPCQNFYLLLFW